LIGLSVIA